MQISRVLLVYDVKISQLGRKNLAARFDMDQIGGGGNNCQNAPGNNLPRVDFGHKSTGAETPSDLIWIKCSPPASEVHPSDDRNLGAQS
jgi:hypothetical protein